MGLHCQACQRQTNNFTARQATAALTQTHASAGGQSLIKLRLLGCRGNLLIRNCCITQRNIACHRA